MKIAGGPVAETWAAGSGDQANRVVLGLERRGRVGGIAVIPMWLEMSLFRRWLWAGALLVGNLWIQAADLPNLNTLPADLNVPPMEHGAPRAGHRVEATTTGWEETDVRSALYLPRDWRPEKKWPVFVEFAGNGGFKNALGDVSDGTVGGSALGYGLSGGEGMIWVCMPYVEVTAGGRKQNCTRWWGDVAETKRHCVATVREVCAKYGGDPTRVVLGGFSRGAIACNYLGLHDDEIAGLWCAFFCHSHYDGVRRWPYADSDEASAIARLRRLNGRPQWISQEVSVEATRGFIERSGLETNGAFTLVALPFANHTDKWVLRDIPERRRAREWLAGVVGPAPVGR